MSLTPIAEKKRFVFIGAEAKIVDALKAEPLQAGVAVTGQIEMIAFSTRRNGEESIVSRRLIHELGFEFRANLIGVLTNNGSDRGRDSRSAGAKLDHRLNRVAENARYGTTPAGMSRTDDADCRVSARSLTMQCHSACVGRRRNRAGMPVREPPTTGDGCSISNVYGALSDRAYTERI